MIAQGNYCCHREPEGRGDPVFLDCFVDRLWRSFCNDISKLSPHRFFAIIVSMLLFIFFAISSSSSSDLESVRNQAIVEFGELPGINITNAGGHLMINGEVAETKDYRRIEDFAKSNPRVINRVHLSNKSATALTGEIQNQIESSEVRVRPLQDKLILEGPVYNQNEAARAQKIAETYGESVVNLIEVRKEGRYLKEKRMIKIDVHMMEMKKQAIKSLGINWTPGAVPKGDSSGSISAGASGLGSIGSLVGNVVGIVFNLVPKLNFIRQKGEGRVLENPQLLVKNAETGEFFSGTEIPYYNKGELNFKQAGVKLNVEPIIHGNTVDFKIDAMLSSPSAHIEGGIDTSTVKTSALCQFGESVVLANLNRAVDRKMRNRIPKDLDTSSALFTLALSKDYQAGESEFVIFLTPSLVVSGEEVSKHMNRWKEVEKSIKKNVLPKKQYEDYLSGLGVDERKWSNGSVK